MHVVVEEPTEDVARENGECNGFSRSLPRIGKAQSSDEEKKKKNTDMEFSFDINPVLPHEITIINGDYRILNQGHTTRIGYVPMLPLPSDSCFSTPGR